MKFRAATTLGKSHYFLPSKYNHALVLQLMQGKGRAAFAVCWVTDHGCLDTTWQVGIKIYYGFLRSNIFFSRMFDCLLVIKAARALAAHEATHINLINLQSCAR